MTDTLQIIVSVVGVGVVILLALVGAAWRLGGRLGNLDGRLELSETRIDARLERV